MIDESIFLYDHITICIADMGFGDCHDQLVDSVSCK